MIRVLAPDDPGVRALQGYLHEREAGSVELNVVPWPRYRTELDAALAEPRGRFEAVAVPGHVWLPELVADGRLAPLGDAARPERRGVLPSLEVDCRYDGATFLLPLFTDGHIVVVRRDLLPQPSGSPDTRELLDLARAGGRPPGIHGIALKAAPDEIALDWLPHYWMAGGRLHASERGFDLDEAAAVVALERYLQLLRLAPPETLAYGNDEVRAALRQGRAAMAVTWGGQAAALFASSSRERTFAAVAPRQPWNATWGLGVPAGLGPARREEAEAALLQLLTPELDHRVLDEAGSPVLASTYDEAATAADLRHPWLDAQRTMLARARPLPATPRLGSWLGVLTEALLSAARGASTPEAAIRTLHQAA